MATYLITGRSGTGKSTIAKELSRRSLKVLDGDKIVGLSRWEELKTGKPVEVDTDDYVDFTEVAWNWNGKVLEKTLKDHNGLLFICGSASNQLQFHKQFDAVFVLSLDKKTHQRRILERKNYGNYGKHPKMLAELLEDQQSFANNAIKHGAISINAVQNVEKVVDDILRHVNHER